MSEKNNLPIWSMRNKRAGSIGRYTDGVRLVFLPGTNEKGRSISFELNQLIMLFLRENGYKLGYRFVDNDGKHGTQFSKTVPLSLRNKSDEVKE